MRTSHRVLVRIGSLVVAVLALGGWDSTPAAAGGGGCARDRQSGPSEGTGATVELVDLCMSPTVLRVEAGTTVEFVNRDEMMHNVYGSGMFVNELRPGARVAFRFDDAGTYPFTCTLHPGMVGAIAVGDGRRAAPPATSILPVSVSIAAADVPATTTTTTTTTAAPVALAATGPARDADDGDAPVGPAALATGTVAAGTVALVAYAAGRRRRRASVSGS